MKWLGVKLNDFSLFNDLNKNIEKLLIGFATGMSCDNN